MTPVTMFSGANGPLNGAAGSCGVTVWVVVAGDGSDGDTVAAARLSVCRAGLDVVFCNVSADGDCSVWALLIEFTCGFGDVEVGEVGEVGNEALRDDVLGVLTGVWPVGLLGPLAGSADVPVVVGADLAPIDAGVSELGNTDEVVRAPPVLSAMPVRGSGVVDDELPVAVDDIDEDAVDDGEVEPVGEGDPDDGLDELVDEEADEEDELDDEELEDELELDGSANATPCIVAAAEPTPSATANAPTRPT